MNLNAEYGHALSPQAYRRLSERLSPSEAAHLSDDIADELRRSGVSGLTTGHRSVIFNVLRRGA